MDSGFSLYAKLFVLVSLLFVISFATDCLSKHFLLSFPFPFTLTLAQFAGSTICAGIVLASKRSIYKLQRHDIIPIFALVTVHSIGFFCTNLSLATLNVSFMHTIKASEALFTAFFSFTLLHSKFTTRLLLSLVPIVLGVTIASATEFAFDWFGFGAAVLSNVCFALRSTGGQRLLHSRPQIPPSTTGSSANDTTQNDDAPQNDTDQSELVPRDEPSNLEGTTTLANSNPPPPESNLPEPQVLSDADKSPKLDEFNIYFYLSLLSTLTIFPFWLYKEFQLLPPMIQPTHIYVDNLLANWATEKYPFVSTSFVFGLPIFVRKLLVLPLPQLLVNGVGHYTYNQISFVLLSTVVAVTHVVINACRRIFVIYASVVWLENPLTWMNIFGTCLVILGVVSFAKEKARMTSMDTTVKLKTN